MSGAQDLYFLRNLWYYALPGHQLKPGQLLGKTLLEEPILLGRTEAGEVFAIRDLCPHRGVPLKYGKFLDSEVECPYHGWRFNPKGECTLIPGLVQEQRFNTKKICLVSYPVQEIQGNIWIYMADKPGTPPPPDLDIPLIPGFDPDFKYQAWQQFQFPCHVDYAISGLVDPQHVPFVHKAWWWRTNAPMFEKAKAFDPSPLGFTMRRHRLLKTTFFYRLLGGTPEVEISFRLPGVRIEATYTGKNTLCNLTTMTPITATQTEVTTLFYWTTPWITWLKPILLPFVNTFVHQDLAMVTKQQEGLNFDSNLMLVGDGDMQVRWYYQVKKEFAAAQAEGREFSNPVKSQILKWRS